MSGWTHTRPCRGRRPLHGDKKIKNKIKTTLDVSRSCRRLDGLKAEQRGRPRLSRVASAPGHPPPRASLPSRLSTACLLQLATHMSSTPAVHKRPAASKKHDPLTTSSLTTFHPFGFFIPTRQVFIILLFYFLSISQRK